MFVFYKCDIHVFVHLNPIYQNLTGCKLIAFDSFKNLIWVCCLRLSTQAQVINVNDVENDNSEESLRLCPFETSANWISTNIFSCRFLCFLVFLVCTAACRCYSYKVPRKHHLFRPRCCVKVGWSFVSFFWKTSAENCRFVFLQCPNIFRVFVFSLVYWIHWPNDVQQHWRSHLATDPPLALICGVGFRVCRTIFVFCHIGTWRWFIHIAKFYDVFLAELCYGVLSTTKFKGENFKRNQDVLHFRPLVSMQDWSCFMLLATKAPQVTKGPRIISDGWKGIETMSHAWYFDVII